MRLIDADEAIINFGFEWDDICPTRDEVVSFLRKQKTIDAVPVVRGRWVAKIRHEHYPSGKPYEVEYCSVCEQRGSLEFAYCPNCGAKMED